MSATRFQKLRSFAEAFSRDDRGSMTVWGLFVFFVCGILGAFALDVTHLMAARTHLQVAADQAAHAALYQRYLMDEDTETVDDVKDKALTLVAATLPSGRYGITMDRSNVNFGTFDTVTRTWTTDETSTAAVRAVASFSRDRNNAAITFLFRLIGRDNFDVTAQSVFVAYRKACTREGFVANGIVDIQSNNNFVNGFCIHSNTHVSVNQRNSYEKGTIVSMPNTDDLDLPGGVAYAENGEIDPQNFKLNEGLLDALTSGYIDLRQLPRMENMIHNYLGDNSIWDSMPNPLVEHDTDDGYPSYINEAFIEPVTLTAKSITTEEILAAGLVTEEQSLASIPRDEFGNQIEGADPLLPETNGIGRVYLINCQGNSGLTIDATGAPLADVIVISPCEISFKNGSAIERARVITTATSADSISATNGLIVGKTGSCDDGAQFFTLGGMRFPAGLEINGSQLVAKKDIQFAAGANGLSGASFIAGGEINGTSNGDMGLCGTGMDDNLEVDYFRMAL